LLAAKTIYTLFTCNPLTWAVGGGWSSGRGRGMVDSMCKHVSASVSRSAQVSIHNEKINALKSKISTRSKWHKQRYPHKQTHTVATRQLFYHSHLIRFDFSAKWKFICIN